MKFNKLLKPMLSLALSGAIVLGSMLGVLPTQTAKATIGVVYYIDSTNGSDNNNGTSEGSAWRNVSKINTATILPGDQILLKSGSSWNNQRIEIKFSGDAENQIIIGKYGEGTRPVINGGGGNYTIKMENRQYITIQDIEITNYNLTNPLDYKTAYYRRSGIWIVAHHDGPKNNIQLKNLDIHNVTGMSIGNGNWIKDTDGNEGNKDSNAAILVNTWEWNTVTPDKHAYYNNLLIEGNYIHDIQTLGININGYQKDIAFFHKNLIVRNNTMQRIGTDGIELAYAINPLIDHNICLDAGSTATDFQWIAGMWAWGTQGATFQYNEVGRTRYVLSAQADSAAFDTDIATKGDHIYQYNYTHENAGGFFMNMGQLKEGRNILRYNISQNDEHHGNTGNTLALNDENFFYNNVFYNDTGDGITMTNSSRTTFVNNIFYTSKGNTPYPVLPRFYCNNFYGATPPSQGINNIVADPKFVNGGTGGDGLDTVAGYKLQADSPLIGAGKVIVNNGGKDFFGNPLYKGSPDIGAFEDQTSEVSDTVPPVKASGLVSTNKSDTTVTLAWSAMENNMPLDVDIYDATTNTKLASADMTNTYTVTGLTSDVEYSFYVVVKDFAGNASENSDTVTVRTTFNSVIVDNSQATITGTWTPFVDTTSKFYGANYVTAPSGDGTTSIKWIPDLPRDGFYEVSYWLPKGKATRTNSAAFDLVFAGGMQTYNINERTTLGGEWVKLGMHKFVTGTSAYIELNNSTITGEVSADAVKFQYIDGFGYDSINKVTLYSNNSQLRIGEKGKLTLIGTSLNGYALDLSSEGLEIEYSIDDANIATVAASGEVTGLSSGICNITATASIGESTLTSETIQLLVGPCFTVSEPVFTNDNGAIVTYIVPNSTVNAAVNVVNSKETKQKVSIFIALFNDDGLIQASSKEIVVNSYAQAIVTSSVRIPAGMQGCYIKVYVWDGINTMRPLAPEKVLQ